MTPSSSPAAAYLPPSSSPSVFGHQRTGSAARTPTGPKCGAQQTLPCRPRSLPPSLPPIPSPNLTAGLRKRPQAAEPSVHPQRDSERPRWRGGGAQRPVMAPRRGGDRDARVPLSPPGRERHIQSVCPPPHPASREGPGSPPRGEAKPPQPARRSLTRRPGVEAPHGRAGRLRGRRRGGTSRTRAGGPRARTQALSRSRDPPPLALGRSGGV